MPLMNGYQAAKEIKNKISKENYINANIIGYTANSG